MNARLSGTVSHDVTICESSEALKDLGYGLCDTVRTLPAMFPPLIAVPAPQDSRAIVSCP